MKKKINKKKIVIVVLWIFLIIGLGIYILLNPLKEEKKDKKPEKVEKKEPVVENYKLSWIGAGDALIHDGVFIDARTGTLDSNGYPAYDFTKSYMVAIRIQEAPLYHTHFQKYRFHILLLYQVP